MRELEWCYSFLLLFTLQSSVSLKHLDNFSKNTETIKTKRQVPVISSFLPASTQDVGVTVHEYSDPCCCCPCAVPPTSCTCAVPPCACAPTPCPAVLPASPTNVEQPVPAVTAAAAPVTGSNPVAAAAPLSPAKEAANVESGKSNDVVDNEPNFAEMDKNTWQTKKKRKKKKKVKQSFSDNKDSGPPSKDSGPPSKVVDNEPNFTNMDEEPWQSAREADEQHIAERDEPKEESGDGSGDETANEQVKGSNLAPGQEDDEDASVAVTDEVKEEESSNGESGSGESGSGESESGSGSGKGRNSNDMDNRPSHLVRPGTWSAATVDEEAKTEKKTIKRKQSANRQYTEHNDNSPYGQYPDYNQQPQEQQPQEQQQSSSESSLPTHPKIGDPFNFEHAAVAADHWRCSEIGKEILRDHSDATAIDAIIATHACVETVNLQSTGLGGGGFMVVYDKKSGKKYSYDFREQLPANFKSSKAVKYGELILVPGVLKGLRDAWEDFGRVPWKKLWQPAIDMARNGFKIHLALSHAIASKMEDIKKYPGLKEIMFDESKGRVLRMGEILKRPKLADTFEKIANGGADVFYKGEIALKIVDDMKYYNGPITMQDLANYRVHRREALHTNIGGYEMLTAQLPAAGVLVSLGLKIMSNFNWTRSIHDRNALTYHHMVEAMKFAQAPFTFGEDPAFNNYTKVVTEYMMDPKTALRLQKKIDNKSHKVSHYGPVNSNAKSKINGTTHMSAVDRHGNAVSLTSSINAYFGSKVRSMTLGIIYNNELADFSHFWPSVYQLKSDKKINGKRPMSRASPLILMKGKEVHGVFGAAGGYFIPTSLMNVLANYIFFHDTLKEAINRKRVHCQLFPPSVVYEKEFTNPAIIEQLKLAYNHEWVDTDSEPVTGQQDAIMGVIQAIVRVKAKGGGWKWQAVCDARKGGFPSGY